MFRKYDIDKNISSNLLCYLHCYNYIQRASNTFKPATPPTRRRFASSRRSQKPKRCVATKVSEDSEQQLESVRRRIQALPEMGKSLKPPPQKQVAVEEEDNCRLLCVECNRSKR